MSISHAPPVVQARLHSELCFDISHDLCDDCARARDARQHARDYQALRGRNADGRDAEARERARRRDIAGRVTEATGIPLRDLAAVLLPELAEGITEIVTAVIDERGQHE